jgi:hypothetical protein
MSMALFELSKGHEDTAAFCSTLHAPRTAP